MPCRLIAACPAQQPISAFGRLLPPTVVHPSVQNTFSRPARHDGSAGCRHNGAAQSESGAATLACLYAELTMLHCIRGRTGMTYRRHSCRSALAPARGSCRPPTSWSRPAACPAGRRCWRAPLPQGPLHSRGRGRQGLGTCANYKSEEKATQAQAVGTVPRGRCMAAVPALTTGNGGPPACPKGTLTELTPLLQRVVHRNQQLAIPAGRQARTLGDRGDGLQQRSKMRSRLLIAFSHGSVAATSPQHSRQLGAASLNGLDEAESGCAR